MSIVPVPRKSNDTRENIAEIAGVSGPVPRWIPFTLLAFSSVAIIAPVILFRRYKTTLGRSRIDVQSLRSTALTSTAPPRRGRLRGSKVADTDALRLQTLLSETSAPSLRARVNTHTLRSPPQSTRVAPSSSASELVISEEDRFNAPLYTLKAFSVATAIVISSAAATIACVMSYLDVRDTAEFAARMRTWVSNTMPTLSSQIYRQPQPRDCPSGVALIPSPEIAYSAESSTSTNFDHDASQQRLADAFDKGGFDTWAEVVEREMEAEIEMERSRKRKGSSETT